MALAKRKVTILLHKAINISPEFWQDHKIASRAFKKLVKKAKRDTWKEFTSSVKSTSGMAKLTKALHCLGFVILDLESRV